MILLHGNNLLVTIYMGPKTEKKHIVKFFTWVVTFMGFDAKSVIGPYNSYGPLLSIGVAIPLGSLTTKLLALIDDIICVWAIPKDDNYI